MTVEAAVVIPLTMVFLIFLLFFFRILQIQTSVQSALLLTGRKTAVMSTVLESDVALYGVAEGFLKSELANNKLVDRYVSGGVYGVTLLGSSFEDTCIALRTTYQVEVPVPVFRIRTIWITQGSYHHKWIGDTKQRKSGLEYVYITETGDSYHSTRECPYLDLSISAVAQESLKWLRNKEGRKYSPCPKCIESDSNSSVVFITDYGTRFHEKRYCSHLKRTVYEILKSEIGNRDPCNKCVGGE